MTTSVEQINQQIAITQDLNNRLDQVEEFYLPDIIEHEGEPLARVTHVVNQELHPGAVQVRPYRRIELVNSSEKIITARILDSVIITMFAASCVLLYNSIVWTIRS